MADKNYNPIEVIAIDSKNDYFVSVKDIIEALKKVPESYQFLLCGEGNKYSLILDKDNSMVSIEFDNKIDEIITNL